MFTANHRLLHEGNKGSFLMDNLYQILYFNLLIIISLHLITSHDITWHDITSHEITWHHITSHHMTWHDMTLHHMKSHDITWHHMTSHDITWHHTDPECVERLLCEEVRVWLSRSAAIHVRAAEEERGSEREAGPVPDHTGAGENRQEGAVDGGTHTPVAISFWILLFKSTHVLHNLAFCTILVSVTL